MPTQALPYIWLDHRGVAWVGATNRKVIEIAMDHRTGLTTAEEISDAHFGLPAPQVQAALDYYLAHKADYDAEIDRHYAEVERLREESLNSPMRQKLRSLGLIP